MSLHNSRGRLIGISRELQKEWNETKDVWRDRKGREFDRDYMQPLMDAVDNASHAIDDLDKILRKLREDCEIK
jgi:hypothetical protein